MNLTPRPFFRAAVPLLAALALLPAALRADSSKTTARSVTQLAEGVHVIRHADAPDGFPQGNTTVIIGRDAVLVVDSCYLPSAAREDIAQIRQWTDKPVRYLVNTHWHFDHTLGNATYADAFPGLAIIAHRETRNQIRGYNPGWFERYPLRRARILTLLETGKRRDGTPLTDDDRRALQAELAGRDPVQAEFQALVDRAPGLTFTDELAVDLGGREVRLLHLGRGNTAGDIVVFLPKERIVATGDLLDHPIPYVGGGYPFDQVKTLTRLAELDAGILVPGHGDVLRGEYARDFLRLFRDFLAQVTGALSDTLYRLGNNPADLEKIRAEVEKAVDMDGWRQKFAGDDPVDRAFFDGFTRQGVVNAAFAQTWTR